MHLCLPRKVHGRLNSLPTTTNGNEKKGQRERAGGKGGGGEERMRGRTTHRTRGFTRSRESKFMRRAGTDISQKMNHPYTSGPTHRGNSGTIVRQ